MDRSARHRGVDGGVVEDRLPHQAVSIEGQRIQSLERSKSLGREVVMGGEMDTIVLEQDEGAEDSVAEPHGAPHDRVEHGLDVCRRAADDPQDLARGRLLLQRLGEVAIAGLQLGEQPDVLDGDDGLVGKGLQQLDLLSEKGRTSRRRMRIAPMGFPSRRSGVARVVRCPVAGRASGKSAAAAARSWT